MAFTEAEYEALEGWENESEAAERAAVRRLASKPSFKPRPSAGTLNYVTQTQLEAITARLDSKITKLGDSVATIDSKHRSLAAASKKESEEKKKLIEHHGKDLNQKLMMLAILPALTQPTITIPAVKAGAYGLVPLNPPTDIPAQTVSPNSNTLNLMLPALAVAGGGLSTEGDSTSDNNMLMMLALMLALQH